MRKQIDWQILCLFGLILLVGFLSIRLTEARHENRKLSDLRDVNTERRDLRIERARLRAA